VRASSGRSLRASNTPLSSCAKTLPCAVDGVTSVPPLSRALFVAGLTEEMRTRSGSRRLGLGQIGSKRSSSRARTEALKLSASLSLAPAWRNEQTRARASSQKDDTCNIEGGGWGEGREGRGGAEGRGGRESERGKERERSVCVCV
jgi:hypothetical protein